MTRAPIDELRALPPPLQRATLARLAAEHGPEAVAALRWQIEAHRRPAQRIPKLEELPTILVITGEYGTGKTQLATWIFQRAILAWRVHRPRVVAATKGAVEDTVVHGASGILSWLPPWVSRSWQTSTGHAGTLTMGGHEVSCISAEAGGNAIGSGSGFVLFDDYAKCVDVLGAARAEEALVAAFKSLREWPGKMLLPTTPDGAEMVLDLAQAEGMRGVGVMDLGRVEDNAGNLARGYVYDIVHNLRKLDRFSKSGAGAFAHIQWPKLRVREVPQIKRAIAFVDPAKSQRSHACKVGIVGVGIDARATVYGLADRSAQRPPDGEKGWPSATLELAEWLEEEHGLPRNSVELGIECNTLGDAGPELLRAEERARRTARGEQPVAIRKIHKVTSRPRDPKTRRAAPVVGACESNQVRMVVGLGELEASLSGLTDGGTKSDAADAFVHGARIVAGWGDEKAGERAATAQGRRDAFDGFAEAQKRMPAPAYGAPREADAGLEEWDRV